MMREVKKREVKKNIVKRNVSMHTLYVISDDDDDCGGDGTDDGYDSDDD